MLVHSDAELYALLTLSVERPSFCPSRNCPKYPNRYHAPSLSRSALTYRCSHVVRRYFYHVGSDVLRPFLACFLTLATFMYLIVWAQAIKNACLVLCVPNKH